jgi:hypothetical protein
MSADSVAAVIAFLASDDASAGARLHPGCRPRSPGRLSSRSESEARGTEDERTSVGWASGALVALGWVEDEFMQ